MHYLYHWVPADMRGDTLYPLNELKGVYPDLYEKYLEKYKGRERVLEYRIPKWNCLWNDVLHMSAVHPSAIKKELQRQGQGLSLNKFYEIDPSSLERENTVIYLYSAAKHGEAPPEEYIEYDPNTVGDYSELPEKTRDYFKEIFAQNGNPLLWHLVPHFLYKGTIDISSANILEI